MGGGDLNLKKSWHPQTLRNVEKVWKAEQKHEAERKKIEELQRELREERAREEMQRYAEDVGAVKKKEEKLDWMYQGPGGMVNRDEYLLGRPIDKYVFEKMEEKETGCSSETGLLPGSIFAPSGANSLLDMASKIREDPLFIIRKKEEEKKREVLNNPVKMKKIKELVSNASNKHQEYLLSTTCENSPFTLTLQYVKTKRFKKFLSFRDLFLVILYRFNLSSLSLISF